MSPPKEPKTFKYPRLYLLEDGFGVLKVSKFIKGKLDKNLEIDG